MNKLKTLREEKQKLQSDVAQYLGITTSAYGFYENEKRDIPTEYLIKLSEYFNVSIDYILGKSEIRNPEINLADIRFANDGGISTDGLSDEEIEELKRQVEFMRWKKENKNNENNKK